jgi:hypothetical protein
MMASLEGMCMAKQPGEIGELVFQSKKDAKACFREMLGRYVDGQTIEPGDAVHLEALMERHPEAEHKIGGGIKRFYRDATDQPTSCFWIERTDGSCTDFSFHSCVDMKGKSLYQEFSEACREAVRQELIAAKGTERSGRGDPATAACGQEEAAPGSGDPPDRGLRA